jgi:excisionase family DNA binding protein
LFVSAPTRRPLERGDILTVSEVSDLIGVPASTVGDWARRGIIPSLKLGRRRVFIRAHLEARLLHDGGPN